MRLYGPWEWFLKNIVPPWDYYHGTDGNDLKQFKERRRKFSGKVVKVPKLKKDGWVQTK